jgi:YD repeat-containing protein
VRRTRYTYDSSDRLLTYAVDESTTPTGTDGGWAEIDTTFYTYHSTSDYSNGLLKHVVMPNAYKQMKAVNSSWPEGASDTELDLYADKKYVSYDSAYRVASLATKGGRYTYSYQYTFSSFSPGSDFNIWTSMTVVTQPDGSGRILYFNQASQLMLRQVADNATTPTKTWNQLYQKFEDGTGLRVLSAGADAIDSVNDTAGGIVTLKTTAGLIHTYTFDSNRNLTSEGIRNGTNQTTPTKLYDRAYTSQTAAGGTIYLLSSETIYPTESSSPIIPTSWAYTFHDAANGSTTVPTFQIKTVTVTLPSVPTTENGTNTQHAVVSEYDQLGFLIKETSTRGIVTTYEYDKVRGGLTKIVEDVGTGTLLNLITDFEIDDLGRESIPSRSTKTARSKIRAKCHCRRRRSHSLTTWMAISPMTGSGSTLGTAKTGSRAWNTKTMAAVRRSSTTN